MPSLREQLRADLRDAMRARDTVRRNTIRMLEAAIRNAEIERRDRSGELAEADVLAILQRQVKQRRDSIEQFEQGGRADLAANERAEIAIIETYLPQQLSRDEVVERAQAVMAQVGAAGAARIVEHGHTTVQAHGHTGRVLVRRGREYQLCRRMIGLRVGQVEPFVVDRHRFDPGAEGS